MRTHSRLRVRRAGERDSPGLASTARSIVGPSGSVMTYRIRRHRERRSRPNSLLTPLRETTATLTRSRTLRPFGSEELVSVALWYVPCMV